jgi:protein SCO1/2
MRRPSVPDRTEIPMARSAKRDLRVIAVGATLGVALVVGMLVIGMRSPDEDEGDDLPRPSAVQPRLGLAGEDGQRVTLQSLRGDYALVTFGFTQCPDVCPNTLLRVALALEQLGPLERRIQPLLITLDPERDTPERLLQYTRAFGPRIEGLRGSQQNTRRTARSFGIRYESIELDQGGYTIAHTSGIFLLGPEGDCLAVYPHDRAPDALANDLRTILTNG